MGWGVLRGYKIGVRGFGVKGLLSLCPWGFRFSQGSCILLLCSGGGAWRAGLYMPLRERCKPLSEGALFLESGRVRSC